MCVSKFHKFYNSSKSKIIDEIIDEEILNYWPNYKNENILSFGYNLSPDKNNIAIFGNINIHHKISIDYTSLPFENDSVDKILISNCLEFFIRRELLLQELWRILSPNGVILIIVPNKNNLIGLHQFNIYRNCKLFSLYQILELISDNNFNIMKSSSRIFLTLGIYKLFPKLYNFVDATCSKWLIPFGGFIFVKAKKDVAQPILDLSNKIFANNML